MPDVFRALPTTAPAAPRELSADIQADAAVFGRFLRLFGGLSAAIGGGVALLFVGFSLTAGPPGLALGCGPGGLFAIAGVLLWSIGRAQRARALQVFRDGVEVSGQVVRVYQDYRVRMNGQHPFRVVYEFMADGKPARGTATFWDPEPPVVANGDRVTVLHARGRPSRSVLWTRLEQGSGPRIDTPVTHVEEPRIAVDSARIEAVGDAAEDGEQAGDEEERGATVIDRADPR